MTMKLMDMVLKKARMKMDGKPMAMGMDEPMMEMDMMGPMHMDPLVMAMKELMEATTPEAKAEAFRAAHDMLHMEREKYYGEKYGMYEDKYHKYDEYDKYGHDKHYYGKYGYDMYGKYGKYGK